MPAYAVADIVIDVPFPIPELPMTPRAADWAVTAGAVEDPRDQPLIFETRAADGGVWVGLRGSGNRYVLSFPTQVDFLLDLAARTVVYDARADTAENSLRHLLIDQVVPHLLAADSGLVLHASAVATAEGALAFVGPSGTGKSSLAAALVTRGATLLADDFLLLRETDEGYEATAAYPSLRLWEDAAEHFTGAAADLPTVSAYTDKRRWAVAPPATDAAHPLRAIVILGRQPGNGADGPACEMSWARGSDAFVALFKQGYRIARDDRAGQVEEQSRYSRLVERVPLMLLRHRHDYTVIDEVLDRLADGLATLTADEPGSAF
jgi:hypothetical protein